MTSEQFVGEITQYFDGKYTPAQLTSVSRAISNVPEDRLADLMDWLQKNNDPRKIGVNKIYAGCEALMLPTHRVDMIKPIRWNCDCCGTEFSFIPEANEHDRVDSNLHDVCPQCGFWPEWTIRHRGYLANGGADPFQEHYDLMTQRCLEQHGPGKAPWFNRTKIIAERTHEEKARRDLMRKELMGDAVAKNEKV